MTLANIYTTTSVHVPRVSYSCPQSPQETLQDQHIGLAQAPMKSPLVPWASARETLCTLSKSRISFSPVLCSSCTQAPIASQASCSGGFSSQSQTPRLGILTWGAELSLLWENFCQPLFSSLGCPPRWYGIWLNLECTPFPTVLWFLICVFGCRISFSSMVVQQLLVILAFLKQEVSSCASTLSYC